MRAPCPGEVFSEKGTIKERSPYCEFYESIIRYAFELIGKGELENLIRKNDFDFRYKRVLLNTFFFFLFLQLNEQWRKAIQYTDTKNARYGIPYAVIYSAIPDKVPIIQDHHKMLVGILVYNI